ncbi:MAG: DUF1189 domain-containing protein [Candidatus Omnitrophota bacterium]
MENKIDFFTKIIRSIISKSFYRDVKSQSFSVGFKYLLTFFLIITVILSVRFSFVLTSGTNFIADWISTNIPDITIKNGEVSSPAEQPYLKGTNEFVFILDTTGQVSAIAPEYKAGILVLKNKIMHKQSEVETREYDLSKTPFFVLNKTVIDRVKKIFIWVTIPLMVIFLYLYYIVISLGKILGFSLLTLIINKAGKLKLNYRGLLNIGAFSLTLPVILGTAVDASGMRIPYFWVMHLGVYVLYLVIMTLASKEGDYQRNV